MGQSVKMLVIDPTRGYQRAAEAGEIPVYDDGDSILLIDADGVPVNRVTYSGKQVRAGEWIEFGVKSK